MYIMALDITWHTIKNWVLDIVGALRYVLVVHERMLTRACWMRRVDMDGIAMLLVATKCLEATLTNRALGIDTEKPAWPKF